MFRKFAHKTALVVGSSYAFWIALFIVTTWIVSGPLFDFSNTWQLIINTLTTISTFLMVFLIQNTQNRNDQATQLKLDEIIRSNNGRKALIDLEDMTDEEIGQLVLEFQTIHEKHASSPTMKKLHEHISREHTRRSS